MEKKSVLEQALLQIETLEEAVKKNAKGILASTMKQELNEILKEQEEDEEDLTNLDSELDIDNANEEMPDEEMPDEEMPDEEMPDEEMPDEEMPDNSFEDDNEDVLDMTHASHDEVIKIFKSLKPEDGVIVKKDDDQINLNIDDDEYLIDLGDDSPSDDINSELQEQDGDWEDYDWDPENEKEKLSDTTDDDLNFDEEINETDDLEFDDVDNFELEFEEEFSDDEKETNDETMYEIELDDEDYSEIEAEMDESSRTLGFGYHGGLKKKKTFYSGNKRDEINEEYKTLKKQNEEYKKALVLFKEKLDEVAVFNANLAFATKLFTEHSTTKKEKVTILERFDSISTITESKNLYKQIKGELANKQPINEDFVNKITTSPKTSTSKETLSENKSYENPQFKRMKELMFKIK